MEKKDKFIIKPIKKQYAEDKSACTVRCPIDAYNTLVDMANDSCMSMSQIIGKAIMFAYEHLEYGYEEEE